MKKSVILLVLAVLALPFTTAVPGYAAHDHFGGHGHERSVGRDHDRSFRHDHDRFIFRGGVWIGPGWGPWWDPYPYYPGAPVIIQQEPQVYVQPAQQPETQKYWYFCKNTQSYYPYVKECSDRWLKVVPPSSPPGEGMGDVSP